MTEIMTVNEKKHETNFQSKVRKKERRNRIHKVKYESIRKRLVSSWFFHCFSTSGRYFKEGICQLVFIGGFLVTACFSLLVCIMIL